MRLSRKFFERNTLKVAQDLLGKILCVKNGRKILKGVIIETEAYKGEDDLACHASRGRTKRTETMYRKAGTVYVYMIYGMHHCLNIVTEKEDYPSAVLIRGVIPITAKPDFVAVISGPGRVCRHFGIDRSLNGEDISGKKIWIEGGIEGVRIKIKKRDIIASKRIGIDYAKRCKDFLWRFNLAENMLK